MALIDFVIPVYNVKKYIKPCVESIKSQDFNNFNIILIDDGSTDGSSELCDIIASEDERISVIHKKNGGLSDARNFALNYCTSEYVTFFDGDDLMEKNMLEKIANKLKNDTPDVMIGRYIYYYENTNEKVEGCCKLENNKVYNKSCDEVIQYLLSSPNYTMEACRYFIKLDLIKINNLRFKKGFYHEDEEWTPRLLCSARKFSVLEEPYYIYRQRSGSIMASYNIEKELHKIEISKILINNALNQEYSEVKKSFMLYRAAVLYINIFINYCEYNKEERKKLYNIIKGEKYILNMHNSKKVKTVKIASQLFGIRFVCRLLHIRKYLKSAMK
ncbi:glycosyltransferase [Clostridium subterminale]|uniref:Glycosyltransferase n=1 Tax=Clostridium subterminale TaxID=1550 RepID=A0ABN1KIR5_CLOSU